MSYSRLKVQRVIKNKTQEELAASAGVSRTTVSNIENGKIDNIQLRTLKKIATTLDSTVQELFLNEE